MFTEMLKITNIEGTSFGTASNIYDVYQGDKDQFEDIIDGLILHKYAEPELRDYILRLPEKQQRVAALSCIGADHLLWSRINEIIKKRETGYKRFQDVYLILRDYVKIADVERKKHGEILTPFIELAQPMINLVDKYDIKFWQNPNNRVLDSSAGYGTFLLLAAYKFMKGLKEWEPNEEKRFKWIVENCLYYGELQVKSVFSWLVIIDPYKEYKTNIYWGDFLSKDFDKHAKNYWNVEKFNLIIQNPPYQERKEGFKKTQPMWNLFVKKSISILEKDGYLVMVHPSGWRNVDGVFKDVQNLLKERQILELHIQNEKEGLKLFGADTRFDFYILKNCHNFVETIIKDQNNNFDKINISKMDFIPNGAFKEIFELVAINNEEKVNIIYSRSAYGTDKLNTNKEKKENFQYPIIYTVPKGDKLNLMYSSCNNKGHFGQSKLIWSNGRIISVGSIIDINGEYGLTQFSYAIVDEPNNLSNIKIAFDSKKFRNLMELSAVGDMSINRKVIATFKKDFWKKFI